jgi:peptide/nickel transport system substrate-binding protein
MGHERSSALTHHTGGLSRRDVIAASAATVAAATVFDAARAQDAATPASTPQPGGTLRVAVQGDPSELDPHKTVLNAAGVVIDLVYDGLVKEDDQLVPQPALAESWTISEDGLTYTFTLRSGVTFHNGRALTSADVQYSFERLANPDTASPSAANVAEITAIETPDEQTVVMTLAERDASFIANLCRPYLAVVPREVVEENGDLNQVMVGTGPFVFREYVPNTEISFDRNSSYWDEGKPYVDELIMQIAPDDTSRTTALVSGTVDLIEAVPQKDIQILEQDDSITLAGDRTTNLRWIVFNLRKEPFNNPAFRQAIAKAVDRQPIIDAAVFGYGEPLVGLFPPSYWAAFQGAVPVADLDAAKELLASVELPEGFRPQLLTWQAYDFLQSTAVVLQEQLRQLGIESDIDPQENAVYLGNYISGNFDIAVMGASGYIDPNDWILGSFKTGGSTNAAGYSSPDMDQLIAESLATEDQDERAAVYQEIQQLIIDEAPWISLYTSFVYEGLRSNVRGYTHRLSATLYSLRNTWLES